MNLENVELLSETVKANIEVHKFLIEHGFYDQSPHLRPENRLKVNSIIDTIIAEFLPGTQLKAIDFGCGSGFIIDIIRNKFEEVVGVDVCHEMLSRIDTTASNIKLYECVAEKTPFSDASFDFATAYSFMDHLEDPIIFLKEVYRVLKPGGVFYADLNPNKDFIENLENLGSATASGCYWPLIEKEIKGALNNGALYKEQFNLDNTLLEKAEPIKSYGKGFSGEKILEHAKEIGFSRCRVESHWFLGEGTYLNSDDPERIDVISSYLEQVSPLVKHLYKYLRFIFVR